MEGGGKEGGGRVEICFQLYIYSSVSSITSSVLSLHPHFLPLSSSFLLFCFPFPPIFFPLFSICSPLLSYFSPFSNSGLFSSLPFYFIPPSQSLPSPPHFHFYLMFPSPYRPTPILFPPFPTLPTPASPFLPNKTYPLAKSDFWSQYYICIMYIYFVLQR